MATVTIFSGVSCATASMSMPPSVETTKATRPTERSTSSEQIELAGDVGAVLDIEAVDLLAGWAGLLGHQRVAEHFLGVGDDFVDRLGQPHAALGVGAEFLELALAAAAGMDLALHHIERPGQRLRRGFGFVGLEDGHAFGDRQRRSPSAAALP